MKFFSKFENFTRLVQPEGWTATGIRCTRLWNYVELFWNSLDNASSSIVFYLEMKVEVEVGVHDIRSWFTPRRNPFKFVKTYKVILMNTYMNFV